MKSLKIRRLVLAMAEHEGWFNPTQRPDTGGSRSYRNSNPLNLRSSPFQVGNDGGFAIFNDYIDGLMAAEYDIFKKCMGETSTGLNSESTLSEFIFTWAPVEDGNDSAGYLSAVVGMTGFSPNMKLKEFLK